MLIGFRRDTIQALVPGPLYPDPARVLEDRDRVQCADARTALTTIGKVVPRLVMAGLFTRNTEAAEPEGWELYYGTANAYFHSFVVVA